MPPTKQQQEAEATARAKSGADPTESRAALDVIEDGPRGAPPPANDLPPRAQEQQQPVVELPPALSKRNEIVARFRTSRSAELADQSDEFAEAARAGLPPEFAQEPPQEPTAAALDEGEEPPAPEAAPAQAAPPAAPRTVKVKVHGVEREVPYDEVIEKAQIAYASENILDEVKTLRQELLADRNRVARGDPMPANHSGQPTAHAPQPQAQTQPSEVVLQNQDDEFAKVVEALQFGEASDAGNLLEKTIESRVNQKLASAVDQAIKEQRLRDEGARTKKVVEDFKTKHADVVKDPLFEAAIQTRLYQLQREDLTNIGVNPDNLPTATGHVTPGDIAMAHRWYRTEGMNLRSPDEQLNQALKDVLAWKGVTAESPADPAAPAPNRAAPRVEVTVDRTARRQAIPQQPERAAAPRAPVDQSSPQPRDRSSIVEQMKQRTKGVPRRGGANVPA